MVWYSIVADPIQVHFGTTMAELNMFLECLMHTVDVKMKCAVKLTKICASRREYAKSLLELEKLQKVGALP